MPCPSGPICVITGASVSGYGQAREKASTRPEHCRSRRVSVPCHVVDAKPLSESDADSRWGYGGMGYGDYGGYGGMGVMGVWGVWGVWGYVAMWGLALCGGAEQLPVNSCS